MEATVAIDGFTGQAEARSAAADAPDPARAPAAGGAAGADPPWAPPDVPGTATGALLDGGEVAWAGVLRRLGAALALSAAFGTALGMRGGGVGLARHAAGVPLGLAVVAVLVAPALFIGLLHTGVRVEAGRVGDALARAAATAGLMLAGLAPLAALVAVSSESPRSAAAFGWLGLTLAGALGLRQLARDVAPLLAAEAGRTRLQARCAILAFGVVSALLAARVWAAVLPVLGGGAS
jgi:hypothetical protein